MDLVDDLEEKANEVFSAWYQDVNKTSGTLGWGVTCAGITLLENLMVDYDLDFNHQTTAFGTQLKNQGNALGQRILTRWDVQQKLPRGEFGRTTRGGPRAAGKLLPLLQPLKLEELSQQERNHILSGLQKRLKPDLLEHLRRKEKVVNVYSSITTEQYIKSILDEATPDVSGAIAQHLVGAKLQLRYPTIKVSNHPTAAADAPTDRGGDFLIGDTIFHVTLSPQNAVYEKCQENISHGYRVYLLVPREKMRATLKRAQDFDLEGSIMIQSIEAFIGQNIDELAQFTNEKIEQNLMELLKIYNERSKIDRIAPRLVLKEEAASELPEFSDNSDPNDSTKI